MPQINKKVSDAGASGQVADQNQDQGEAPPPQEVRSVPGGVEGEEQGDPEISSSPSDPKKYRWFYWFYW